MEISDKPMTIREILEDVKNILSNIEIPVAKIESIGIPIARSINGLQVCLDAIKNNEDENAKQEKPEIEDTEADASGSNPDNVE